MKILIIGTGYVGLVTGACLSELGHSVTCLDIDKDKIDSLLKGNIPFYEPGLKELVHKNTDEGRLTFTTEYDKACLDAEAVFLAVPTPSKKDGSCDLTYFHAAATSLARYIKSYCVIINKSTVPCGTYGQIESILSKIITEDIEIDVVSNPEFLKEGSAVYDCMHPDRIIIGTSSLRAQTIMQKIYEPLTAKGYPLILMDRASAELTKYAANAMLALRISFMNELSHLCEKLGADIHQIKKGIGSDRRIGPYFLNAGIGYGGSCFPKDIKALIATAHDHDVTLPLLEATEEVNQKQKVCLVDKLKKHFEEKGGLQGKKIALWGLSFKPETDDMREAPSLEIIEGLRNEGCLLSAYDPIATDKAKKLLGIIEVLTFCSSPLEAATGADATVLITEWDEFLSLDMNAVKKLMKDNAFFDGRNAFCPQLMQQMGYSYYGIGIANQQKAESLCPIMQ